MIAQTIEWKFVEEQGFTQPQINTVERVARMVE